MTNFEAWIARGTNAIIAVVRLDGEYGTIEAAGEAIRHPEDAYDQEIGEALALARAFINLGRKLERRTMGLVKHKDDVAKAQAKAEALKAMREVGEEALRRFVGTAQQEATTSHAKDLADAVAYVVDQEMKPRTAEGGALPPKVSRVVLAGTAQEAWDWIAKKSPEDGMLFSFLATEAQVRNLSQADIYLVGAWNSSPAAPGIIAIAKRSGIRFFDSDGKPLTPIILGFYV